MASLSASFKVGSTGASSLLRSASSVATAQNDYNDKLQWLTWSNSAKTDADWQTYVSYLNSRVDKLQSTGSLTDASKALTLMGTVQSAQKSWVSSTIQRQSIDILEGNGTLQDKANAVASFYNMASSNGDDGLAQSLRSQYDSIDQQIQYQAQQQQDLASSMAAKGVSTVGALISTYKQDLIQFSQQFNQFGARGLDALSKQYADNLRATGVNVAGGKAPSVWDIAHGVASQMADTLQKAINVYGPVAGSSLVTEYNNLVNGTTTFDVGGLKLNYGQLQDATMAAAAGQQYARAVDQGGKTVLVANKETGYMWGKDPTTGQFKLVTAYTPQGADLGQSGIYRKDANGNYLNATGSVIAKQGKAGQLVDKNGKAFTDEAAMNNTLNQSQYSYSDLLKNSGFNVRSGPNGSLYISSTDKNSNMFNVQGLEPGEEVQVLRGANGQLRFIAPPDAQGNRKMFGLSFKGDGSFSSLFEVNPLSDTTPGFAGSLSIDKMINSAQVRQTQVQKIAELKQQQLDAAAKLSAPPSLPPIQIQPAAGAQAVQPAAPVAKVIQPAAPISQIQNANGNPQQASGGNINQGGTGGVTLHGSGNLQGIPL